MPEPGCAVGQQGDEHERAGEDERQHVVGQPAADGQRSTAAKSDPPDGDHPPERRQRQRRRRRRRAELARHVELRPVAVHRLADRRRATAKPAYIQKRRGIPGRAGARRRRRAGRPQRQAEAPERRAATSRIADSQRKAPPEAEADEDRDEHRRERRAQPEQRVEHEDRAARPRSGWNAAVSVFSAGTVRPKPAPRKAVATSSSGNATACRSRRTGSRGAAPSRRGRGEAGEVDPLRAEAAAEPRAEERGRDRGDAPGAGTGGRTACSRGRTRSGSVKIVLAAGNVTSTIPCTIAAALTTVFSVCVATLYSRFGLVTARECRGSVGECVGTRGTSPG